MAKAAQQYPVTLDGDGLLSITVNGTGAAFLLEPAGSSRGFPVRVRVDDSAWRERILTATRPEPDDPFKLLKFYFLGEAAKAGDLWTVMVADRVELLTSNSPQTDDAGRVLTAGRGEQLLTRLSSDQVFEANGTYYLNNNANGRMGLMETAPGPGFDVSVSDAVELVASLDGGGSNPVFLTSIRAYLEVLDRSSSSTGSPAILERIELSDGVGALPWDGTSWRTGYLYAGTGNGAGFSNDTGTKVIYGRRLRVVRPALDVTVSPGQHGKAPSMFFALFRY